MQSLLLAMELMKWRVITGSSRTAGAKIGVKMAMQELSEAKIYAELAQFQAIRY